MKYKIPRYDEIAEEIKKDREAEQRHRADAETYENIIETFEENIRGNTDGIGGENSLQDMALEWDSSDLGLEMDKEESLTKNIGQEHFKN